MIIDCARVIELKINTKKKERDATPSSFSSSFYKKKKREI